MKKSQQSKEDWLHSFKEEKGREEEYEAAKEGKTLCPNCKVFVKNLARHLDRKRCSAVHSKRMARK